MRKNTISLTAWVVAMCHVVLSGTRRWEALVASPELDFYKRCIEYCRRYFPMCRMLGALPGPLWLVDHTVAMGAAQHFIARKKAIAAQVRECINAGTTQLVVIAGGFDALALTIAKSFAQIACFEIDMPDMQAHKLCIAREYYGKLPANFHPVSADLSQTSLGDALAAAPGFDRGRPTLFVAEGLTMYLQAADVERLFGDIRKLCSTGAVIFTALEATRKRSEGWGGKLREIVLSRSEENFRWGMDRDAMAAFLGALGFSEQFQIGYAELQKSWRNADELAALERENGEYLVYAVAI